MSRTPRMPLPSRPVVGYDEPGLIPDPSGRLYQQRPMTLVDHDPDRFRANRERRRRKTRGRRFIVRFIDNVMAPIGIMVLLYLLMAAMIDALPGVGR